MAYEITKLLQQALSEALTDMEEKFNHIRSIETIMASRDRAVRELTKIIADKNKQIKRLRAKNKQLSKLREG